MHQLALKALRRENDPAVMLTMLMRETYWVRFLLDTTPWHLSSQS
jgi:hypothetical protein